MILFVKVHYSKTLTLDVETTDTVLMLKQRVEDEAGYPPHLQRMIFVGKELDDDRTVAEYNISKESTVHMTLHQRVQGPNHTLILDDGLMFPSQLKLDPSRTSCVQIIDALGTIPFTQNGADVLLARPAVGDVFVRPTDGDIQQVSNHGPPVLLTVVLPDGSQRTVAVHRFQQRTEKEVMANLFRHIREELPESLQRDGFDLFITRPFSQDQVLLDGAATLVSPENATRTIHVRAVLEGAAPVFRLSEGSSSSTDDSDNDSVP